jgi:hypothetical protein
MDVEKRAGWGVLIRRVSNHNATAQSEQAFSDDGGKTWEVNRINHYTRIKDVAG